MKEKVSQRSNGTLRVQYECETPSCTRQEFKKSCDLAQVLKRFAMTPEGKESLAMAQGHAETCQFFDVSSGMTFHTAQSLIADSRASMARLPAEVRARFGNDPAAYLDFVSDPASAPQLREWGLLPPLSTPPEGGEGGVISPST